MQNIKGKVVAITGASSGMGKAIAIELAKNCAKVVLGARRTEQLQQVVEEIKNKGGVATFVQTDVKHKSDLVRLANTAVAQYGKLDVIVNNAGVSQLSRIDELDIDGWEEMIDINLKGVLYGMAAAIPVFKNQESGHIVNIISTSGIKIVPMQGVYAGTKNAIRTIAEAFRQESNGNIRITGISPGFVKTDFANNIKNEEVKTAIQKGMEQMAIDPIAIANAVIYAVSQPDDVEIGYIVIRPSKQN
ncbi:SDR family oxidoreductase [Leeuwenhoekiella marinoflava]|uniref:NADP-dependent 3-hydroxy acid dehydrogenase YdfG n=2 Tax=Leeuwenhoekiella marinoflava TaxID=988 RepID=A0A4Q0PLB1_9FLAO|nr:SDR family oxidoreductase [Leeuwenhoekiella marinoflava]RXG28376.1 NADP-dependent 3-hydroxy acid dehydrogenase YdfG [Leeuwenhoekiella marinoflava]SHF50328.1 NADP-dependent 3-hydroxy acid dehydrogenase YdfG [Leeuwenhoekiella marinoflava DSM 3653]